MKKYDYNIQYTEWNEEHVEDNFKYWEVKETSEEDAILSMMNVIGDVRVGYVDECPTVEDELSQ